MDNAIAEALPELGEMEAMRMLLSMVGVFLVLNGLVWFLQGINVLPGSFMTGQIRWALYGGISVIAGIAIIFVVRRGMPNE